MYQEKKTRKRARKVLSFMLAAVMVLSILAVPTDVQAASKKKAVTKLSVATKSINLVEGKSKNVKVTVKVTNKASKKFTVKSSSSKVATAKVSGSNVKITAKKAGTATITVTTKAKNKRNKKLTAKINVTVTPKKAAAKDQTPPTDSQTPGTVPQTPSQPSAPQAQKEVTLSMTPSDGVIRLEGTTVSIRAVPVSGMTGSGVPRYQWYKDGAKIEGATANPHKASEAGQYTCEIIYDDKTLTSDAVAVTSTVESPTTDEVEWTVSANSFDGNFAYHDEETGKDYIYPIKLKSEYVSFNPWPTTVKQVQYVIRNCDDPFVIGALYVVAQSNYVYTNLTDDNCGKLSFDMMDQIQTGAGLLQEPTPSAPTYLMTNQERQDANANGLNSLAYKKDGVTPTTYLIRDFASRTFCVGATPENGYAPNGNTADINDKTKWKIRVDQYVYCFDQVAGDSDDVDPIVMSEAKTIPVTVTENGIESTETIENFRMPALHKEPDFITVCPEAYKLETDDGVEFATKEHPFSFRIGLRKSKAGVWIPSDNIDLNKADHGNLPSKITKFKARSFYTNDYVAPDDVNDSLF